MEDFSENINDASVDLGSTLDKTEGFSPEALQDFPEDTEEVTPEYDYRAMREGNPFAFDAIEAKVSNAEDVYRDLHRWEPAGTLSEFAEDLSEDTFVSPVAFSSTDTQSELFMEDVATDNTCLTEAANEDAKTLEPSKDVWFQKGVSAVESRIDAYRDDLRDKGFVQDEIDSMANAEYIRIMNDEFGKDFNG